MKIAFFEIQGWETEFLKKELKGHSLSFFKEELHENNASEVSDADIISIFVHSNIDKKMIDSLPKLKMIATRSTGFDHVDVNECKKKKITVCYVPSYGENTVAEHTFALLLDLSRNIHKAFLKIQRDDFDITGLKGFDLKGKTIGVVGLGHIGQHVIRIAKGFEMNVLVCTEHKDAELAKIMGFRYVTLKELLSKSDVITLHVPLTKETYHLINRRNIKWIKKGAVLINTARGAIVETEALLEALDKRILSGVGLDVLEGEELIKEEKQLLYRKTSVKDIVELAEDHILMHRDNVIFTPHIAFYSNEALQRIIETTVENVKGFLNREPVNIVK